ncbi:MAG: zinc-ribbon domain-containing protein [Candidatus Thorarchaeota archaeon]
MSENEVICPKCGKVNRKDSKYCIQCGNSLEEIEKVSFEEKYRLDKPVSSISSTTPPKIRKKIKPLYKVLIFFAVATIVNFIFAAIIMGAFQLPGNAYLSLFFGLYILSIILTAIFWGAGTYTHVHGGGGEAVGIIIGGIVVAIIAIPAYIFTIFQAILGTIFASIGEVINNAINNAISSFFSELFSGIEIPGFEPFLFVGLFLVLSFFIIYRYHLKVKNK